MTFYPGNLVNHTSQCGGELNYVASLDKQQKVINIPSSNYACEYRINVQTLKYRNSGSILIWLESTFYVNTYIYSGNAR